MKRGGITSNESEGDYYSLAEAVGEAPPRTGITGGELAEMYHDCGEDDDMFMAQIEAVDAMQTRRLTLGMTSGI